MFKKTAIAVAAVLAMSPLGVAHADGEYGYTATSPKECTADYPLFEVFEDDSAGCFRMDTPGLEGWAPGDFEQAILNDPQYDTHEALAILGITYDEAVEYGWLAPQAPQVPQEADPAKVQGTTPEPSEGRSVRPSLPSTGN